MKRYQQKGMVTSMAYMGVTPELYLMLDLDLSLLLESNTLYGIRKRREFKLWAEKVFSILDGIKKVAVQPDDMDDATFSKLRLEYYKKLRGKDYDAAAVKIIENCDFDIPKVVNGIDLSEEVHAQKVIKYLYSKKDRLKFIINEIEALGVKRVVQSDVFGYPIENISQRKVEKDLNALAVKEYSNINLEQLRSILLDLKKIQEAKTKEERDHRDPLKELKDFYLFEERNTQSFDGSSTLGSSFKDAYQLVCDILLPQFEKNYKLLDNAASIIRLIAKVEQKSIEDILEDLKESPSDDNMHTISVLKTVGFKGIHFLIEEIVEEELFKRSYFMSEKTIKLKSISKEFIDNRVADIEDLYIGLGGEKLFASSKV